MSKGPFLRKYGVQTTLLFDLFEVDGVAFRVTAAHAAGDSKIMKDEGAEGNTTNGFVDEGQSYSIVLTATEMQAARIKVIFVDSATKLWLDTSITVETYGNASAQHAMDFDDAVRGGMTALPNAAAEATGGLYTRGTGAGQVNQTANGRSDSNVVSMATDTVSAGALATDAVNELARAVGIQTNTAFSDIEFLMVDETNHVTPETALTVTGQRSLDGAAFADVTGSIANVGSGIYQLDASAADMNGAVITFKFIATGADDTFLTIKTVT